MFVYLIHLFIAAISGQEICHEFTASNISLLLAKRTTFDQPRKKYRCSELHVFLKHIMIKLGDYYCLMWRNLEINNLYSTNLNLKTDGALAVYSQKGPNI